MSYLLVDVSVQFLHRLAQKFWREGFVLGWQLCPVQDVGLPAGQEPVVPDQVGRPEVDLLQALTGEGPHLPGDPRLGPAVRRRHAPIRPQAVAVGVPQLGVTVHQVLQTAGAGTVAAGVAVMVVVVVHTGASHDGYAVDIFVAARRHSCHEGLECQHGVVAFYELSVCEKSAPQKKLSHILKGDQKLMKKGQTIFHQKQTQHKPTFTHVRGKTWKLK